MDKPGSHPNRVRELREDRLMTQAQLARKAKVALRTIHSVEKGMNCRMDTKRPADERVRSVAMTMSRRPTWLSVWATETGPPRTSVRSGSGAALTTALPVSSAIQMRTAELAEASLRSSSAVRQAKAA